MHNKSTNSSSRKRRPPQKATQHFDLINRLLVRLLESVQTDRVVLIQLKQGGEQIQSEVAYDVEKRIVVKTPFQLRSEERINELIPVSLVKSVSSGSRQLMVDNPHKLAEFKRDPYFRQHQPAFVFCSKIPTSDQVSTVVYLEDKKPSILDMEERRRLLSVWVEQVELSLENAHWLSLLQEDLTERLQEISAEKKKNRAGIQFLADMNHEVRDPLNSIVGFSQLLMKKDKQLQFPADVRRYLENIEASGTRLAELLDNIMEYSRLETANSELVKEEIDFKLLINSIYLANRQFLSKRSLQLRIELGENVPNLICSARSALTKTLMILLKFCILRSPPRKTIVFKAAARGSDLIISINDNGDRFSTDSQQSVFASFAFLKEQSGSLLEGSNFDLAIAKQLVESLQGSLEYKARREDSSQIILTLPNSIYELPQKSVIAWKPFTSFRQNSNVLLLGDNHSSWELLESMLKDLEIKYEKTVMPPKNLDRLRKTKAQLIFIDLHLPQIDQKAKMLLPLLKSTPELHQIPLIALVTRKSRDQYQTCFQEFNLSFLTKPFGLGELVKILNENLQSHETSQVKQCELDISQPQPNRAHFIDLRKVSDNGNQLLVKALQELVHIPIYKGGTIISQINKIKANETLSKALDPYLLPSLKSAVYEGNAERFQKIIKEAIEGK